MPRPPKNKAPEPAVHAVPAIPAMPTAAAPHMVAPQRVIDVDNFIRVRDSVYARLTTIQDLIKSFSVDYLRQTNLLLGEGTSIDNLPDPSAFEHALGGLLPQPFHGVAPIEERKERKKRSHDPNAPKRPLTPYFLYMQTARPIIAGDLGTDAPKGAVQEEGQRRWKVMGASEKHGWNQAYQYNLRLYNARVHAYKHGNPTAKDMSDEDAIKYADQFKIEMSDTALVAEEPIANEQEAIEEQLQQSAAAAEPEEEPEAEEEVEEPEEVEEKKVVPEAKTPKKAAKGRRKTATPAAVEPEPKPVATPASPGKKRKRTSKAAAELVEEPKKSARTKKAKAG